MAAKPVPAVARSLRALLTVGICIAILLSAASPAVAQKKKKNPDAPADTHTTIPMPDEQQIDYNISEMLGAWQVGDVDRLHKTYADDAVFVSGLWAPPVFGWSNFLPLFQQQRARMERVRMDRSNTYIKVAGTVGWACYQWDFEGIVDGQPMQSQGQTSVVLEKRNNHWVIALNHTSLAPKPPQAAPAATPSGQQQPAKPASP